MPKFKKIGNYKIKLYLDGIDYVSTTNNLNMLSVYQNPIFNETRYFQTNDRRTFIEVSINCLVSEKKYFYFTFSLKD